jgi:hypothetical protein
MIIGGKNDTDLNFETRGKGAGTLLTLVFFSCTFQK